MNPIDGQGPIRVAIRPQVSRSAPVERAEGMRPIRSEPREHAGSAAAGAISAGAAPVDPDRVAAIRNAIEQGRYSVVPIEIADAMIAAGYLERNAE